MSLAIDIDKVFQVLLADGWHTVVRDSFYLDAYEYIQEQEGKDARLEFGGGEGKGAPSTGFGFTEMALASNPGAAGNQTQIAGPISSILAVRIKT